MTWLDNFGETDDEKNKPYKPFLLAAGWLFSGLVMASGSGTLAPVVVSLANGGQANIAVSNTDPNLFTVPGDRITAVSGLDGMLTNSEQTGTGGVVVATVSKKPFTFILETERGLNFSVRAVPGPVPDAPYNWSATCAEPGRRLAHGKRPPLMNPCWLPSARQFVEARCLPAGIRSPSRKKRCRPRPVCLHGLTLCGPAIT